MQPVDLSHQAQDLGPGIGGLWLGEQQRNAMQESELSQQNTLEQIANSQQTRDIQKQKLPLELQQMRDVNERAPVQLAGDRLKNQETEAKLSKEKYNDFLRGLSQMDPELVDMPSRAGYLNELSKRSGIPADHPMYQMALQAHAAGGATWKKFQEAMDPKLREEREKTEAQVGIHAGNNATQERVAGIQAEAQRYAADQRLKAAQAKAAQGANAMKNKSFAEAYNYYKGAADDAAAAGDMTAAQALMTRAQEALAAAQAVAGAGRNTPQAGGMTVSPEGGLQVNQPQPLPQSAAPTAAAARPGAAQAGAPPVAQPQPQPAAQPSALARPADKAARDALPPGTQYVGPDGQTYTKR